MELKKAVIIEVRGGVAYCTQKASDVPVIIYDHDNADTDPTYQPEVLNGAIRRRVPLSELIPDIPHPGVLHGLCPICGHYGEDCTEHEQALERNLKKVQISARGNDDYRISRHGIGWAMVHFEPDVVTEVTDTNIDDHDELDKMLTEFEAEISK